RVGQRVSGASFCSAAYPHWERGRLPEHYRDGGTPFRDLGVHGLYLLRAALGEIAGVEPVFVTRGSDPNLCFDEWDVIVLCERGVGRVRLSWSVRPLQTLFTVHATGGTLRAAGGSVSTTERPASGLPHALDRAAGALQEGWPALRSLPVNGFRWVSGTLRPYVGVRRAVEQFYVALAEGSPLPASLDDGRRVVRWVEATAHLADVAKRLRDRAHRPDARADALVTGATGRLGRQLVEQLLAPRHRLRAVCRRPAAGGALRPHLGGISARDLA